IALILFFFSSRRRHTRFSRDWSSDVCSSDLALHSSKRLSPPKTGKRPRRTLAAGGRGTRDRRAYPFIGRVVHGRGGPTAKICPTAGDSDWARSWTTGGTSGATGTSRPGQRRGLRSPAGRG